MQIKYKILIGILIVIALASMRSIYLGPTGIGSNTGNAIQAAGIFVALVAAVIALSVSDPKQKSVKINRIEPYLDIDIRSIAKYHQKFLADGLKDRFKQFPDPIRSHRVYFEINNLSGFTLKKPFLTFRLPNAKQCCQKSDEGRNIFDVTAFGTNLFNYQRELVPLQFEDITILANNILPYWNDKYPIKIWIRMIIDDGIRDSFSVEISVNCENAEGITQTVQIDPKKLLDQLATASP